VTIEATAHELYALRPSEFIAARDAKVAQARQSGDRELASAIKAMRRPTVSAWVTNLFALERGERLEQLFSLGAALREAQAGLSGDTLRRLGEQRREVIGQLAVEAAALAAKQGQTIGPQIVADVEQTLHAALADPDAAEQVKAGQLTTALSYTGFGDVGSAQSASGKPTRRGRRGDAEHNDDDVDDRRDEELRKALQDAEHVLTTATREAEQARQGLDRARHERERRARAVERLERQLTDARSQLSDADAQVKDADASLSQTEAAVDDARRAVKVARADI
jgi:hypothetical protein